MFKLFVSDTNVDSGSIPVSWCVSKDVLDLLKDSGVKEPQVVLCIVPQSKDNLYCYSRGREYRKVIPLSDLVAYVEFYYSGTNKIYGYIPVRDRKKVRDLFLSKTRGAYDYSVVNSEGDDWREENEDSKKRRKRRRDVLSVDVPKECFAPEPPAWEKAWVNHFFDTKCIDQCHYRRRRIFAYTVQPFIMLLNMIFRLLILMLGFLLAARGLENWRKVFLPLTYPLRDLGEEIISGGTFCIRKSDEKAPYPAVKFAWHTVRHGYTLIFLPLIWVALLLVCFLFGFYSALFALLGMIGGTIAIVMGTTLLAICIERSVFDCVGKFLFGEEKYWYTRDDEMINIICDGTIKTTKISNLPRKHRTIKLRFSALKSKVCKPFAG